MKQPPEDSRHFFPISLEQQKLLASAIRIQILHTLADAPRTAKQVADLLGQSPGNIHYHMLRLFDGGLIQLVETREVGGIVEKYYKAEHVRFRPETPSPAMEGREQLRTHLLLTKKAREALMKEVEELLLKWESRVTAPQDEPVQEYDLVVLLELINREGEK